MDRTRTYPRNTPVHAFESAWDKSNKVWKGTCVVFPLMHDILAPQACQRSPGMLIRSVGQESTHARGDQSDAVVHPPFVATGFASLWARDSPIFFMAFVDCGIPEIYACPSTVLVQGGSKTFNTVSSRPGASVQHLVFSSGLIAMILPTIRRVTKIFAWNYILLLGCERSTRASAALSRKMRRSSEMGFLRSELFVNARDD